MNQASPLAPDAKLVFAGSPTLDGRADDFKQVWQRRTGSTPADRLLGEVRGSFSIVHANGAGAQIAAVDRFGVETMCYRVAGGSIQFARRADELAGSSPDICPQSIFDYLFFHAIPSPRTIFRDVHRVPPGHFVAFENGSAVVRPYWTPQFHPSTNANFQELRAEFLRLVQDAVGTRLDGGKPGCFLSGGTDSSTVAGMIGRASGRQAATYSIGFEAEGYDEMAYARIAARHFGTEHHEYYVTPDDLVRSIATVARHYDQPFGNSSALPAFYCAKMAKDDGVTMLLAGDGGDELFGGNSRYAKQRVFGWYAALPAPMRRHLLEPLLERTRLGALPLLRKGRSYVEQAKVAMPARLQMYNLLLRLGVSDVLSKDFLDQVDVREPGRHQQDTWDHALADDELNRTLAFDWRYTLGESDLPKVCGTTALAGVHVAFPMLDDALLDFSLKLPSSYKLKGLKLRWFFKEALRGFLPDEILTKKKQGFGLPFGVWTTRNAGLKALAVDSLASLSTRNIVRPEFVRTLIDHRLHEHPGYYGEMVWILLMLEQWLQGHAPDYRVQA